MSQVSQARNLGKYFLLIDNMLVVLGFFVVFPLISIRFVDQMGWAALMVGIALGLRQFIQQGLGIFGGAIADRFGAKPMIVTGMLMRAGVREGTGGAKVDASRLMAEMTAAQLRSFVTLTENPQYAELRQARRLDGITSASSRQESRQRGFRLGQSLMAAPLLSAFERCNISPAAIFDQPGMPA